MFCNKKLFCVKVNKHSSRFFLNLNLRFGGFSPKKLAKIVKFTIGKKKIPKKLQSVGKKMTKFVGTKSTCTSYQTIHTLLLYCHQIFPKKETFLNSAHGIN